MLWGRGATYQTRLRRAASPARLLALCLSLILHFTSSLSALAQDPPPPPAQDAPPSRPIVGKLFKIGYLAHGSDLEGQSPQSMRDMMEGLREALMNSPRVAGVFRDLGVGDLQVRRCEDPFDMLQRLRAGEFDAAFATSVIYARLIQPEPGAPQSPPRRGYAPVLQSHHLTDVRQPGSHGFFRRASIIIGPGSALWERKDVTLADIMPELDRGGLAVGDYHSAANCVWPLLRLRALFPQARAPELVFCRSSPEVFKHVVSGLVPAGACESRYLVGGEDHRLAREVMRSEPFPTDPFILRAELVPGVLPLRLGSEIVSATGNYFNFAQPPAAPGYTLESVDAAPYEAMASELARFDELFAER